MIKNYFKTAIRNLWRNKGNSFLNIFGLAIGIACAGLIFLWVEDEMTYDQSFAKKDQLYKVNENQEYEGKKRTFYSTPGPLAAAAKKDIPGIVNTCRLNKRELLFSNGDKSVYEKGCYADSSLLSMFTPQFIAGNPDKAFTNLNEVVISKKMANHFFGDDINIIGKTLKADNKEDFVVAGVFDDLPKNSTLSFDWILPFVFYERDRPFMKEWNSSATNTYAELSPAADVQVVDKQMNGIMDRYVKESGTQPFLFAMNDWHLRDNFEDGKQAGGRIVYVRMFSIIAWIILLIACINFMNLATARSEKRAREVGVRKVLGAGRSKLIAQFIGEAVLLSALAVLASLAIITVVLPFFNQLVGKELHPGFTQPLHLLALLCIVFICGIFAGSYPAFYLSSFTPVSVFKGLKLKDGSATFIRKGLVVLQFTISIVLIIGTVVVYRQIQHIKNRDLGYNRQNLLTINARGEIIKNFEAIKQDLLNTGAVENAALNSFETLSIGNNSTSASWQGKDPSADILISNRMISPEFLSTAGMKIIEGRDFRSVADSSTVVITQSLAQLMGKESAVGRIIHIDDKDYTVGGVLQDYVYGDMYGKGDPVMFFCATREARYLYVKLKPTTRMEEALAKVETVMKKDNPAYPFEYSFVDDQFNARFKGESLIGKLSRVFAGLAILISCLGLFGLAAYTAERRRKEIGIRKVLGASTAGITQLLSKDFLVLVFIASVIAFPLAWWIMHSWLQGYAYRITISWWIFIAAGLTALLIALITVSLQAIKAAVDNPVKSLRTE